MNDAPAAAARVLVVDDDADLGETVAGFVRQLGHTATFMQRPGDALSAVVTERFDLVITDLHMAGLDGIALCSRVAGAQPDVPVIVLTGHGSLESAVSALRAGAYDFLTKPVERRRALGLRSSAPSSTGACATRCAGCATRWAHAPLARARRGRAARCARCST